jgi:hypothetical protein
MRYGDAGRHNRLDVYQRRSPVSGAPVLVHFHGAVDTLFLSSPPYRVTDDFSRAIIYRGKRSTASPAWLGTGGQGDYFNETLHESNKPGDSARFAFSGTFIQWIGSTHQVACRGPGLGRGWPPGAAGGA